MWRRVRGYLTSLSKSIVSALNAIGWSTHSHPVGPNPEPPPAIAEPVLLAETALSGPAPGHPERLVPDLTLSTVERALWTQILGSRPRPSPRPRPR